MSTRAFLCNRDAIELESQPVLLNAAHAYGSKSTNNLSVKRMIRILSPLTRPRPQFGLLIGMAVSCVVAVAGELDPQQSEWIAKYEKQANVPKPEEMLLNADSEPDLSNGFTALFNGQDLSGWTPRGGTCQFEAKDGQIIGTCVAGSNSTYLCTDKSDFRNFVFTCDMKWLADGNTGVMFRAQRKNADKTGPDGRPTETVFGPQAEMEGFSQDRHWSGGIYGQSCGGYFYPLWLKEHRKARSALKPDAWNRLTISANGDVVKTWINGIPIAHWVDDGTYPQGFFGLQIHKGVSGTVLWKNIRVKELDD